MKIGEVNQLEINRATIGSLRENESEHSISNAIPTQIQINMQGQQIESNQNYTEVISLCIEKVVNQLIKSGQIIEKVKSLEAIINNNLTNISKSKSTCIELKRIFNSDKTLARKVLLTMENLQIIEINQNGKKVKFFLMTDSKNLKKAVTHARTSEAE